MHKIQSTDVFLNLVKIVDFRLKIDDVSRTETMCHVIH